MGTPEEEPNRKALLILIMFLKMEKTRYYNAICALVEQ